MGDLYVRPYLDSSVFLGWVKNPPEIVNGVNRQDVGRHVMSLAEKGKYEIYTSTFTLAEVHKLRAGPVTDSEQNDLLLKYFEHPFIQLIEVDRLIGEHANQLCRQFNIYPPDAVHMACAIRAGCDVLLAWDGRFSKASYSGLKIEEPDILGQQPLPLLPEEVPEPKEETHGKPKGD